MPEHLHESLVRIAPAARQSGSRPRRYGGRTASRAPTDKVVKNPELAAVLERIAAKGKDGFYTGETADAIVAEMKRGDGLVTAADLAGYQAVWRDPLVFSYRGKTLITMPPPSSGGIVIGMTANMLSNVELGKLALARRSSTCIGSSRCGAARSRRATRSSAIRRS